MGLAEVLITLAFGASIALMAWALYSIGRGVGAQGSIERDERRMHDRWVQVLLLLAEPLAAILDSYQSRRQSLVLEKVLEYHDRRIEAAGLFEELRPSEVLMMVPLAGIFGLFLGILGYIMMPHPALVVTFVAAGLLVPGIWLRDQVARRQDEIRRSLPFAVDLLTLMTEAGLDFTIALERISRKMGSNALAQELAQTQKEIQMGKNRSEAMRNLARRTGVFEMSALTSAIIQADELGAGFGPALRVQAEQIRTLRAQEIEKKALEAPVKVLFPLIVFIFPTTFVIIFGPVFLSYLR